MWVGKKMIWNKEVGESIPRQVDKKSGGPQGERGLGFSRRRKETSSTFLGLIT